MQTIVDSIHGTKPVSSYISPTHVATLARAVQIPGSDQHRCSFLLLVWQRVASGPVPDAPCLIITSETTDTDPEHVLGVYDNAGHQILRHERGDWTDIAAFASKAISLVSERFDTAFVERVPRE